MTDQNIYDMLKKAKAEASECFADRARAAIKSAAAREAAIDALCDALLRRAKISAAKNLADKVLAAARAQKSPAWTNFAGWAGAFAAACALALVCASFEMPRANGSLEKAFAQMSAVESEIGSLAALVYEQELAEIIFNK